jgi:hypothetical protein
MSLTSHPKRKRKEFEELSSKQQEKIKLAERIEKLGSRTDWSCLFCLESCDDCIVMSARPDLKCSNCTRRGKPCVSVSWDVLDRTSEKKAAEIEDAEQRLRTVNAEVRKMMAEVVRRQEEAAKIMESIERNRKVLKQAHQRAEAKTICMLEELQAEEEEERAKKRKRSSSDDNVPERAHFEGAFDFDSLVSLPDGAPPIDWSTLGDPGDTAQAVL